MRLSPTIALFLSSVSAADYAAAVPAVPAGTNAAMADAVAAA
jgi:hypothetical protein